MGDGGGGGVLRNAPILIVKCTLNLGLMGSVVMHHCNTFAHVHRLLHF